MITKSTRSALVVAGLAGALSLAGSLSPAFAMTADRAVGEEFRIAGETISEIPADEIPTGGIVGAEQPENTPLTRVATTCATCRNSV
jgi:hypothetical protein